MRHPPPPRPPPRPPAAPPPGPTGGPAVEVEAEVIPGLAAIAQAELAARGGPGLDFVPAARPEVLRFRYRGDLRLLLDLRTVVAVYLLRRFSVPRPKGLLDYQHVAALLALIETVRRLAPPGAFRTLRISAAGEDSAVLTRLKTELAARTGLVAGSAEADLLLRLRRAADGAGWEVLVRLSPRPLTARPWRVCNQPGALNAVVAQAMVALSDPRPADRYLNLVCGSGTLLIERLAAGPAAQAVGYDRAAGALDCARANLAAAGVAGAVRLLCAEAGSLPLAAARFDVLTADLPFGQLVGTHGENARLYPRLLAEATRVAAPGARLLLITHEVRLLEGLIAGPEMRAWQLQHTLKITLPFKTGG
ncbi:MAG TPA: methyltransferase domain-containing protein, partial [Chloroflexia bacterium]|nr:methyltransferase domain-containing protein [Chloroflexia bacterium]